MTQYFVPAESSTTSSRRPPSFEVFNFSMWNLSYRFYRGWCISVTQFPPLEQSQWVMGLLRCWWYFRYKACLHNNVCIFHVPENALPVKVNEFMIIRNSTNPESKNVSNVSRQNGNAVTFRTALKAVGKNWEYMISGIYKQDFSTMQNIRMQYELFAGLHGPKRTNAAVLMSQNVRKTQR